MPYRRADSLEFIGGDAHAYTRSADKHTARLQ